MKYKHLSKALAVGAAAFLGASFLSPAVFAESQTVSNYDELNAALCEGGEITLGDDIQVNDWLATGCGWVVSKDTTIDFNGHTITSGASKGYNIDAKGATLTFKDSVGGGGYTQEGDETVGIAITNGKFVIENGTINGSTWVVILWHDAKLEMNGGEIHASNGFAITGNGTTDPTKPNYGSNTKITINDGILTSENDYVIYNPSENSTIDIYGGQLTGGSGAIAANRGIINIYGGEFKSLGTAEISGDASQDGTRGYENAVIGIPKEYGPVELYIHGGTFINEGNSKVIADISGLDNENAATVEISGGQFAAEPDAKDIEPGLEAEQNADGMWELFPIQIDFADDYLEDDGTATGHVAGAVEFGSELIADRKATLSIESEDVEAYALDEELGGELQKVVDIKMLDRDNQEIEVEDNDIKVRINLTDEEYATLSAYSKVFAVYFEDGVEAERYDAELGGEAGNYWVEFNTSHLSEYGIVGLDEESEEESEAAATAETPDTGAATLAGSSAKTIAIITAVLVGLVTSATSFIYLTRKH